MVESDSPSSLLKKLSERVGAKEINLSSTDFLKVLNLTSNQSIRTQVYDVLEKFSKYCDWEEKREEFLSDLRDIDSKESSGYLKNQILTVTCLKTAEKNQLNKPKLVEILNKDDEKIPEFEKKKTKIYVEDIDIIDKTLSMSEKYKDSTAMIILSGPKYTQNHKLGSFFAQIGAVCRRTNFPAIVTKEKLEKNTVVYYPELYVFNQSDGQEYDKLFKVKAFQVWSQGDEEGNTLESNQIGEYVKSQMRNLFKIALEKDIKHLVLTALGCGYQNQEPELVASYLKSLIETEFNGAFESIIFAIKKVEGHAKSISNHDEFKKIFKDSPEELPAPTIKKKIRVFPESDKDSGKPLTGDTVKKVLSRKD